MRFERSLRAWRRDGQVYNQLPASVHGIDLSGFRRYTSEARLDLVIVMRIEVGELILPIGPRVYGHSFPCPEVLERHGGAANSVLGLVRHRATHRLGGGALLLRRQTRCVEQPGNSKHAAQDANAPTDPSRREAARPSWQQREGKNRWETSAQITSPPLLLPRPRPIPVPRDLCSQPAVQLRTRGSPSSALLRHHLRRQWRYGIRDKRPCLTPWQRILHQQEESLEHFPKPCPALRESGIARVILRPPFFGGRRIPVVCWNGQSHGGRISVACELRRSFVVPKNGTTQDDMAGSGSGAID